MVQNVTTIFPLIVNFNIIPHLLTNCTIKNIIMFVTPEKLHFRNFSLGLLFHMLWEYLPHTLYAPEETIWKDIFKVASVALPHLDRATSCSGSNHLANYRFIVLVLYSTVSCIDDILICFIALLHSILNILGDFYLTDLQISCWCVNFI